MRWTWLGAVGVVCLLVAGVSASAQAGEGTLSEAEVESLRDVAFVPVDRINEFVKILDRREKQIDTLLAKRWYPGRPQDLHDLMAEVGALADELTDNLDEYDKKHRDVRKALPKLVLATERWSTSLRAPADDGAYNVERKLALDTLKDMREEAEQMETEQTAYFKAHPEAEKAEKERAEHPHATSGDGPG